MNSAFVNKLILFLIIFQSGGIINLAFEVVPVFIILVYLVICFCVLFNVYVFGEVFVVKGSDLIVVLLNIVMITLIYFLASERQELMQYYRYSVVLMTVLIYYIYIRSNSIDIVAYMYSVLFIICIYSLISAVIVNILHDKYFAVYDGRYSIDSYLYLFYSQNPIKYDIGGLSFYRNNGIFWEPGILQYYANLLLYLSLYEYKKKSGVVLALIIIISTWSTIGYFLLCIQFIYYAICLYKEKKVFSSMMIVVVIIMFYSVVSFNVSNKFVGEQWGSSYARIVELVTGANILINNPLGVGLDYSIFYKELEKNAILTNVLIEGMEYNIKDMPTTNSVVILMITFGIFFGIYLLVSLYKQGIIKNKKMFFLLNIFTLLSEPIMFYSFHMLFIVSGMYDIFKRQKEDFKIKERN